MTQTANATHEATDTWTTIKAEDFRPGFRYAEVLPGFEDRWVVESVTTKLASVMHLVEGQWMHPTLVEIKYRDGRTLNFPLGQDVCCELIVDHRFDDA